MQPEGVAHTALATGALFLGGGVLCLPKGTELHRVLGVSYVLCMFGVNLTALTIYHGPRGFGAFHVLALANLALVLVGFAAAFRKRPRGRWLHSHYYFISWSYVGLCAAAGAELAVRLPGVSFVEGVTVPTAAVTLFGGALVHLRHRATLAHLGPSAGRQG